MKMMMLLLIAAVVQLVNPAVVSPTHEPGVKMKNIIIDLAEQYNRNLTKEFFVEDVSHLVEGGCQDKFFCKVYDILHHHFGKRNDEKALVQNLKKFITHSIKNCEGLLVNVTSTGIKKPIPDLVSHLSECMKKRNTGN